MNVIDRRVTGFKKMQRGWACEDSVFTKQLDDCVIMACADGHGDLRCRYASRGAELAARVIAAELERVWREADDTDDFGCRLNEQRQQLAQAIVCSWVGAVLDDYKITEPENESYAAQFKDLRKYSKRIYEVRDGSMPVREFKQLAQYRHDSEEAIYRITHLYGTTVNAAVVSSKFVFAIGLGDGDVIAVNGKRVEWLLPRSARFSTSSDSLSGSFGSMLERFSAIYVPITAGRKISDSRFMPELVMIATDGLRNAFLSDEEFSDKIYEIAALLKKGNGHLFVKNSKQWLEERTRCGVTQDDIAFCLCTRHGLKKGKRKDKK